VSEAPFKFARNADPDVIAPDGAEIRRLVDQPRGATKLSLAEALVKPGERTSCVSHRTIEEAWYIVQGTGRFHRLAPDGTNENIEEVAAGDALFIPTGYRFWVENIGAADLRFLCCDAPAWPGHDEAVVWPETTQSDGT
jgi:mannose-6-phosphate isomerase-like protein (cupin superfamily)